MSASRLSRIIATARPNFLLLTPCCLSLAVALTIADHIPIDYVLLALIFLGALAAHASVNMLNEYQDFISGLDLNTRRTAFSGGSGTLPAKPELAKVVKFSGIACLLITILIGFYFLAIHGWRLAPLGLTGILLVCFYTDKITHWPWLCLLAPGLAFGPLMINGAYFVLTGHYSSAASLSSLLVFFLVNDLLLLNQFPDLQADQKAQRRHLPILIGRKKSARVYAGFLLAAYSVLLLCVWLNVLPLYSLLGLASVFFAFPAARTALQHADDMDKLKPALALNVAIALLTPLLMATGMVLQHP